jgi:hypothetical protein
MSEKRRRRARGRAREVRRSPPTWPMIRSPGEATSSISSAVSSLIRKPENALSASTRLRSDGLRASSRRHLSRCRGRAYAPPSIREPRVAGVGRPTRQSAIAGASRASGSRCPSFGKASVSSGRGVQAVAIVYRSQAVPEPLDVRAAPPSRGMGWSVSPATVSPAPVGSGRAPCSVRSAHPRHRLACIRRSGRPLVKAGGGCRCASLGGTRLQRLRPCQVT